MAAMMALDPGLPRAMRGVSSSRTKVGAIPERRPLPGARALGPPGWRLLDQAIPNNLVVNSRIDLTTSNLPFGISLMLGRWVFSPLELALVCLAVLKPVRSGSG